MPTQKKEGKKDLTIENLDELLSKKLSEQKQEIVHELTIAMEQRISSVEVSVSQLETKSTVNESNINQLEQKISFLENQMDDQINRSLRNTLIFRDINEQNDERNGEVSCSNIIANMISNNLNIRFDDAFDMIDRCHRGNISFADVANINNENGADGRKNQSKIRPIYVKFCFWKDAQWVLRSLVENNIRNKSKIKVDQMYSKSLSKRRNEALILRKDLLKDKSNSIIKAYLAYPARLMVKEEHATKFSCFKSF